MDEVIVIDNGSADETRSVAAEFGSTLISDRTRNLTRLFNRGWRESSGEVVAYLNDDSEPLPSWSEWISRAYEDHPDIAMVGGPTIDLNRRQMETLLHKADQSRVVKTLVKAYDSIVTHNQLTGIGHLFQTGGYSIGGYHASSSSLDKPIEVDQLTMTNVAMKRHVPSELGGFDERFLFNHADGDFFARARRAGLKLLFHPKVIVFHHANPAGPVRNPFFLGKDTARFLTHSVTPRTARDRLGWIFNVAAFNLFWVYKTLETGAAEQLAGILGFANGIADVLGDAHR